MLKPQRTQIFTTSNLRSRALTWYALTEHCKRKKRGIIDEHSCVQKFKTISQLTNAHLKVTNSFDKLPKISVRVQTCAVIRFCADRFRKSFSAISMSPCVSTRSPVFSGHGSPGDYRRIPALRALVTPFLIVVSVDPSAVPVLNTFL